MPIPGKRHFSLTIPGLPTSPPTGSNNIVSNDELVSGEIGQVGTQFDGLGHVGVHLDGEDYFYNGNKLSEFGDTYGLKKLGVENAGVFFTRGILLDVCGLRGKDRLPVGYVISADELALCLKNSNIEIQEGDVVLIRTGHGKLWMKDNATYGGGEPGLGLEAAKFLTDRKVALIGADNWAIEAFPHERADTAFPVHQWDLTRNGVYHLENLDLEQLAADQVQASLTVSCSARCVSRARLARRETRSPFAEQPMSLLYRPECVSRLGVALFEAAGALTDQAVLTTESLIKSSLMGHDSHGVIRIPEYLGFVADGSIVVNAPLNLDRTGASTAVLDCGHGFGPVGATRAIREGIAIARGERTACVITRHCNHVGRLGAYVQHAAGGGDAGDCDVQLADSRSRCSALGRSRRTPGDKPNCLRGSHRRTSGGR